MNSEEFTTKVRVSAWKFAKSLEGEFFVCDADWRLTYIYEVIAVCGEIIVCCNDGFSNQNWRINDFLTNHIRVVKNEPLERTKNPDPLYTRSKIVEITGNA